MFLSEGHNTTQIRRCISIPTHTRVIFQSSRASVQLNICSRRDVKTMTDASTNTHNKPCMCVCVWIIDTRKRERADTHARGILILADNNRTDTQYETLYDWHGMNREFFFPSCYLCVCVPWINYNKGAICHVACEQQP